MLYEGVGIPIPYEALLYTVKSAAVVPPPVARQTQHPTGHSVPQISCERWQLEDWSVLFRFPSTSRSWELLCTIWWFSWPLIVCFPLRDWCISILTGDMFSVSPLRPALDMCTCGRDRCLFVKKKQKQKQTSTLIVSFFSHLSCTYKHQHSLFHRQSWVSKGRVGLEWYVREAEGWSMSWNNIWEDVSGRDTGRCPRPREYKGTGSLSHYRIDKR